VAPDTGDPLAPLRRDPATAGIFSDFDGTLPPAADDPELAEPAAGIPGLPAEPARRYAVMAVVPGRPVAFLPARLPASVPPAGLYGPEAQRHGEQQIDPEAERWRAAVRIIGSLSPFATTTGLLSWSGRDPGQSAAASLLVSATGIRGGRRG